MPCAVLLTVGFIQAADTCLLTLLRHFSNTFLPGMSSLSTHSLFSYDFRLLSQLPSPSRRRSSTAKFIDLCVCARRLTLFISALFAIIRRCRPSTVQVTTGPVDELFKIGGRQIYFATLFCHLVQHTQALGVQSLLK